jgi:hypothetical protein
MGGIFRKEEFLVNFAIYLEKTYELFTSDEKAATKRRGLQKILEKCVNLHNLLQQQMTQYTVEWVPPGSRCSIKTMESRHGETLENESGYVTYCFSPLICKVVESGGALASSEIVISRAKVA